MSEQERRLNAFVRAAFVSLRSRSITHVTPSAGGSNSVVRAGDVFVKVRADRGDDASREAWALACAPAGLAPTLVAHTSVRALVADACARGDFTRARALDLRVGGVLAMRALPGVQPRALDDACAARLAVSLRALYAVRPRTTRVAPRLHVGSAPSQAARLARDLLADLARWRVLSARDLRGLARALTEGERRALRTRLPPARALCHGDLRKHNLLDDGARVRFIDLEYAGVGDPIADVLLFATRTPLTDLEELHLVSALAEPRLARARAWSPRMVDAYFDRRPLFRALAAIAALAHVCGVASGETATARARAEHVRDRLPGAREQIAEVLGRSARVTLPRAFPRHAAAQAHGSSHVVARERAHAGMVVAVDGTASSGKSVIAAALAHALGGVHVNTGLYFRALAFGLRAHGPAFTRTFAHALRAGRVRVLDASAIEVAGERYDECLCTWPVEQRVAALACDPALRAAVRGHVERTVARALRQRRCVIVEGRAIASAWFPHARAALYVDARGAVRAARLRERVGAAVAFADVRAAMNARDRSDATRALEPNVRVTRARGIDTSDASEAASVALALAHVRARTGGRT